MASYEADRTLLRQAAADAGALAMRFFRSDPRIWSKAGGSPVTEADMEVDAFLHRELRAARPDYGWLSEETRDDGSRHECDAVFVIDPIDGTKAFIAGDDCWCVSLAVVRGGRPVAAALYAPARDELYSAASGCGAWLAEDRITVSEHSEPAGLRLSGPRGWMRTPAVQGLRPCHLEYVPSLAYRFALVAAQRLDAAFASARSHDWDLAACDLLVHEAGGRLTESDGKVPIYNEEIPRHGTIAAANAVLLPVVLDTMRQAEREVAQGLKI